MGAGCTELQQEEEKSLRLSRTRTDGRRPQAENAASKAIMIHALQTQQPPREEREPFHPSVSPARAGSSSDCVLVRWALDTRPAGAGTNPLPISSDAGRTPLRSWPPLSVWNRAAPSSLIGREEGARPAGQGRRPPPAAPARPRDIKTASCSTAVSGFPTARPVTLLHKTHARTHVRRGEDEARRQLPPRLAGS